MRIAQFEDKRFSFAVGERADRAVESPFIVDGRAHSAAPDWYQRSLFELSSGDPAMPCRNRFLREAKAAARDVVGYETVRRWAMIARIAAPETGLLALSAEQGAEHDEFTFALVDLVCELRLADRFDIGVDSRMNAAGEAVRAAAPVALKAVIGRAPGEPAKLFAACVEMAGDDDRRMRRIIADARAELIMATRYGALNCDERHAVRTLAKSGLSVVKEAV